MKVYNFSCKSCGFTAILPAGSSNLDQILTDVNTDYSEYRLFKCLKESKFVSADIHDKYFEGKCPSDGSKLVEINPEISPVECPRCTKELDVQVNAHLEEQT